MTQTINHSNYADCKKCHINIYKCGCDKFIGGGNCGSSDQKKEIFNAKEHLYPTDSNVTPFPDDDMKYTESPKDDMKGGADDIFSDFAGKNIYQIFYQVSKNDYLHLKTLIK